MAKKSTHSEDQDDDDIRVPHLGTLDFGGHDKINLDALLTRDFSDIAEACERLPGIMEWINIHLQHYLEKKIILGREAKEVEARAWLDFKQGRLAEDYPNMSVTDKAIDKAALIVPEVMKAHRDLAKYAAWVDRLQNLQLSLQMKYDLVRSSEATRRRVFDEPTGDQPPPRKLRRRPILPDPDEEE
jgi:hypothetical protein